MHLVRTYGHCRADVTCLAWSPCGRWIAAGCKDLGTRVFSRDPLPGGYEVPTLFGHRDRPIAVAFLARDAPPGGGAVGGGNEASTSQSAADAAAAARAAAPGDGDADLVTVSRDGAVYGWQYQRRPPPATATKADDDPDAPPVPSASGARAGPGPAEGDPAHPPPLYAAGGRWRMTERSFFAQPGGVRTLSADIHAASGLVAAGFDNGVFGVYQLPGDAGLRSWTEVYALQVSRGAVSTVRLSGDAGAEWVAVGAAGRGQMLVFEASREREGASASVCTSIQTIRRYRT